RRAPARAPAADASGATERLARPARRGMSARRQRRFDPYAMLHALEEFDVIYVVIGGLARVLQGSDELTRGLDITPSTRPENLERLEQALSRIDARRLDRQPLSLTHIEPREQQLIPLETGHGELKLALEPAGTRGYDDLRRRAQRLHLGEGLRPAVAN